MDKSTGFNISRGSNVEIAPAPRNTAFGKFPVIQKISQGEGLVAGDMANPLYQFGSFFGFQNKVEIGVASYRNILEGQAIEHPFFN